jgi:hypothetical protein
VTHSELSLHPFFTTFCHSVGLIDLTISGTVTSEEIMAKAVAVARVKCGQGMAEEFYRLRDEANRAIRERNQRIDDDEQENP